MIEKKPFVRYTEGEKPKQDSLTIWLNEAERKELEYCKGLLNQPKDSTALKQLAHLGYLKLIGDTQTRWILGQVTKNVNNNKRLGIPMEPLKDNISSGKEGENLTDL
jgi:hypothetical protein